MSGSETMAEFLHRKNNFFFNQKILMQVLTLKLSYSSLFWKELK